MTGLIIAYTEYRKAINKIVPNYKKDHITYRTNN